MQFGQQHEVPSNCALLGGFAIGARVSLLRQHRAGREMLASACTRSIYAIRYAVCLVNNFDGRIHPAL